MSSQQNVIVYSPPQPNLELILELTMEHSPGWIIDETRKECIKKAIETKDLNFLRILTQTIDPFVNTSEYLELAAGVENNIPVIQYLMSLNCPVDHLEVLISAVENKALKNLKFFLQEMKFPIDNYHLFIAAAGAKDNIEMMEYLKSHSCPMVHLDTSISAAKHGALNNLKWLFDNGCSMDDSDIFEASLGSLDILKWLKGKCPIDGGIFISGADCSSETFEWLIEQGITVWLRLQQREKGPFRSHEMAFKALPPFETLKF